MKISELIEELTYLRDEHGDLDVVVPNSGGFYDDEIGLRVEDEDYSSAYGKLVIW